MRVLRGLAVFCALLGGVLLVGIGLMTVTSVVRREFFGGAIVGDFELTAAAAGATVALFLPWCQISRGNIIVDFFTANRSETTRNALDRLGALLLALTLAVLAWRTTLGAMSAWQSKSGTMMLGFPEWIVYSAMIFPMALTAAVALTQAIRGFEADIKDDNPELSV
jgi:TRAP-type C4-dicarboxylate transport system permease small subunit